MIRNHFHNVKRKQLEENVEITKKVSCHKKLIVYEALLIINKKPRFNVQEENFLNILKLFI